LTIRVNAGPPDKAPGGDREARLGVGLLMLNVSALEVPPPGAGLTTVTWAVAAVPMSLAGIAAVSCVLLTKVVVRSLPFHRTTELDRKFVPLTVRVKPELPAVALEGEMELIAGTGFGCMAAGKGPPPTHAAKVTASATATKSANAPRPIAAPVK